MLIQEIVHITFGETNQRLQEWPKLAPGDNEINELQRLKIIADQNNKEGDSAELRKDETVADTTPPTPAERVDLPQEWRVIRDLSLDNVIGKIHKYNCSSNCFWLYETDFVFTLKQNEKKNYRANPLKNTENTMRYNFFFKWFDSRRSKWIFKLILDTR